MVLNPWIFVFASLNLLKVLASPDESKNAKLVNATNCFSSNLTPTLKTEDGNLICSGLSVDIVMSMLLMGAKGSTRDEINKALQYFDNGLSIEDVQNQMHSELKQLNDIKDVTLNIENSLWIGKQYTVKTSYKRLVSAKFLATEDNLDFQNNPHGATETINHWVNNKTHSLIPKLFDKDLDADTIMVLVNAIYFKGTWMKKFNKKNTKTLPFRNNDNEAETKMVSLMNQQEEFTYLDDSDLQATFLEMKYQGDEVKFVAVLPKRGVRLSDVESKLYCGRINEILKSGVMRQVNVTIPKFDITSGFDLQQPLRDLNINTVFGYNADLSGIADGNLRLTRIVQKARIKVYEEGSEAAAVTGGAGAGGGGGGPVVIEQFNANRPFLFYILHTNTGQTLFSGRLTTL